MACKTGLKSCSPFVCIAHTLAEDTIFTPGHLGTQRRGMEFNPQKRRRDIGVVKLPCSSMESRIEAYA